MGWKTHFEQEFRKLQIKDIAPGRIILRERNSSSQQTAKCEIDATLAGRLFHKATNNLDLPVTGDWVVFNPKRNSIIKILPRFSLLFRKSSGNRKKIQNDGQKLQLLSANIDTVFIISGLDADFNLRRIERYLTLAGKSGADSVIILNKSDLCSNVKDKLQEVKKIAGGAPIITACALNEDDLLPLHQYLNHGKTCVLIGSSGVGKSTLINTLLGFDRQKVQTLSPQQKKGRHTTTQRELIFMPQGGVIIDTPGLRELQVIGEAEDISKSFPDIEQLAQHCRFTDCNHNKEPQCAVKNAVFEGQLDPDRLRNYQKLKSELFINSL